MRPWQAGHSMDAASRRPLRAWRRPFWLSPGAWATVDEVVEFAAPATRDTLRQARHGVGYYGLDVRSEDPGETH